MNKQFFQKTYITFALTVLGTGLFLAGSVLAQDSMPARIDGSGTHFEIKNSEYLNVTLRSSEEIKVILESIPRMISLDIKEVIEGVNSSELILEGLELNKTYYKYQDSYKNGTVFVSNENGTYSWTQDLTRTHHIWIQEIKGTTFIDEDMILDHDIAGSVEIVADGIILDCNGHKIIGSDAGYGIYLNRRENITIKNCTVSKFSYGIYLYRSNSNLLAGNIITLNGVGIYWAWSSKSSVVGSNITNNSHGILSAYTSEDIISENIITYNENQAIALQDLSDSKIFRNTIINNGGSGLSIFSRSYNNIVFENNIMDNGSMGFSLSEAYNNTIYGNNIMRNFIGIHMQFSPDDNIIYHNNFINNQTQVIIYQSSFQIFDTGYPEGGNYWLDYIGLDEKKGENQDQSGSDGMGDTPYTFTGGQDRYSFIIESGWEASPAPTFEPDEDGFNFQNFCPSYFDEELGKEVARTWDMFTQFFGQEKTMLGGERRFIAERYFEEEYAKYNPTKCGSCDGFSGTSLINFENLDQPNSGFFDISHYDNLYSQDINDDIKEAITFQQGFQFGQEAISYFNNLERQSLRSPLFFYGKIKEALDNKESIVVWLQEEPKKWEVLKNGGAHALVPYKYEEDNLGGIGYIYVYDSNYPGDNNRILEFDLEKDEWTYEFKKGFWILGETWNGDIADSYLTIAVMPLDMRLNKGIPIWGQEVSPYYYIASVSEAVGPLFINKTGERIGIADGELIDEMLDGTYFIPLAQNQDAFSGLYYLPQEDNYDLTLYGQEEGEMDFVIFGNQSSIKLTSNTDIGDMDSIKLEENSLIYATSNDYKEYSVSFTKESNDLSRLIEINTNISKGDTNVVELTEDGFKYINNGNTKTYNLTLKQRSFGEDEVYFSNVEIGQKETQIIKILDQNNINNSEIIIEIDENSDGVIDKEKSLQLFFEDQERGTKLIINTVEQTFHFITPDKDFGIIKADRMDIVNDAQEIILINYKDENMNFTATAITGDMDFCSASVKDKYGKEHYLLIDKMGEEN